ncbi:hypothetical protein B484DRAFT_410197 [Ochromonadaceae sp. CCMP2298]|nr:hypothetical protein B484DRAFT_410197 [Ochromonadaceae sp. CCMP2298]
MVFTYDLTSETLLLKAKVTLVSQAEATGDSKMSGTSDAELMQQLLDSMWEKFLRAELQELLSTSGIRSGSDFRRFLEMDGNDHLTGERMRRGS